jgi:primase-polymerase (primpol)-like protein
MSFDNIPHELRQYTQWVCWEYKDGQKVPVRAFDRHNASTTNPLDWTSFDRAVRCAIDNDIGIGFVFTRSDPYCGVDLDDANGNPEIIALHQTVYKSLNSYSEWSPSGKGIHIIVKATLPDNSGRHPKYLGLFNTGRYFTISLSSTWLEALSTGISLFAFGLVIGKLITVTNHSPKQTLLYATLLAFIAVTLIKLLDYSVSLH